MAEIQDVLLEALVSDIDAAADRAEKALDHLAAEVVDLEQSEAIARRKAQAEFACFTPLHF